MIGTVGYLLFAFYVIVFGANAPKLQSYRELILRHLSITTGLPVCALASFAVVYSLSVLLPGQDSTELIDFQFFGAKLSGPAGPVVLWVVCYVTLVWSLKATYRE